jgi:hypothetical protein
MLKNLSIPILLTCLLLSGCNKPPESDINEEATGVNEITIHKIQNFQKPIYNNEPPVEPNSLSEPKDYHYKLVFPPLDEPQTSDLLID